MLQTIRLNIRPVTSADLENIHALHSLPETDEFNTLGIPENLEATKVLVDNWIIENGKDPKRSFIFTIERHADAQFIGLAGIKLGKEKYRNAEVWFKFHKDHWGKGYATEALMQLIHFGFTELDLHRIEAGCAVGNTGSWKVMEKAGMQREAHTRQLLPLKSGWSDNYGYAILSTDRLIS